MTSSPISTSTNASPSPHFVLADLVRLLAREAARADFATGCPSQTREQ
jgi:prophage antirepressor-like protein